MANASVHKQHLSNYMNKHKQRSVDSGICQSATQDGKKKPHSYRQATKTQGRRTLHHRRPPPLIRGRATIYDLPSELILDIFSRLEAQELLKVACVCKQWHELANDNLLWEEICKTHAADPGKGPGGEGQPLRPPISYWKSLCIKRCTERRNKSCLKLLKKIHPYTGLPRFTEKAIRSAGVTFQLCLTDNDSREHTCMTTEIFYHTMSVAVRWHSLTDIPIKRVKKVQVFSCNPLFFDEKGSAVRNGPYQKSLMMSFDLRWSSFVREATPVGEDETVALYSVPGADMLVATWKADGDLAFIVTGFHHDHLVQRCILGSVRRGYAIPPHKPIPDDIDPTYGLHHYKCNLEMRNVRTSLWSQQFHNLHNLLQEKGDLKEGYASFRLIRRDNPTDHVIIPKQLSLLWKTELFKGVVKNIAWLDVTLLDERDEVFWGFSSAFTTRAKEKAKNLEFDYNGDNHLEASFPGEKGQVHIELSQMDDDRTFVTHLEINISTQAINEWFLTNY